MANSPLRIGVVGCGVIHSTHCDCIRQIEGATLAAVYDVVPERAAAAAEKYAAYQAPSLPDMWDHVDAITICVPSGLHAEIAIAAARAGKHVLSEKPIDITLEAAESMVEECESAGVKLGVVSQHRMAADVRKLREMAQGGQFGRLIAGDCYNKWYRSQAYYDSGDWRGTWALDGGGCLMNQGVHYVDVLQWIMGGVKSVQAMTRTIAHERIEVEDIANALLEFKNGAVGVLQGSTVTYPGMAERIEIQGIYGGAVLEADRLKFMRIDAEGSQLGKYGDGANSHPFPKVELQGKEEGATGSADPTAIWSAQHRMQIEDFVKAIVDNREPELTGREALDPLKIILAIYESAREGGRVVHIS